jgi:putative nucleotidyltransferase with HDIG domain
LTLREIRDAVLAAKIHGGLSEDSNTNFRRELTRHSLAVACCAEKLAKLAPVPLDGSTAYLAGLLHDIGKFLLDEAMPKSFDALVEEARSRKTSMATVEQENLGIDHTILGKRFAQRLQLPSGIILGIWLHHSQTGVISQAMPQARIAAVVELADVIVRLAGIGDSGSYEDISTESIAGTLGLSAEQIKAVEQQLPDIVRQKSEVAGLTLLKPAWAYCDALRATVGQLAGESAKLSDESARLQSGASHFDFIKELLPKINAGVPAVWMAEELAVAWQRFYQTGPVCVYLTGEPEAKAIEGVIVEGPGKARQIVLDVPAEAKLIPQQVRDKFAVIDADDSTDWLLDQLDVEFNTAQTKLAPLQSDGRTVGIIVFELRHPAKGDISERFEPAGRFGGATIDMLEAISGQQWYAESFARLLSGQRAAFSEQRAEGDRQKMKGGIEGLTEMAAGAAHEMNNPLSVISGRAQLLAKSETDVDRRRILEQIQQNAGELSAIIDDLMSYAKPESPRPTETTVKQIIDEAVDLTILKKKLSRLDAEIDVPADMPSAFVDSAQIVSAISNILCNGLESYDHETGTLTIKTSSDKTNGTVSIEVIDSGRGMDEQTLARATQPFFSARPAGRKRGMGLANAQRLIEINNGKLELASQTGKGTTVTVTLPVARVS